MITRGDALTSLQLANSAKQDTSSMEVIAIMTMVFLPGTFFATLFAVPSLNWNSTPVVQDKFWVYWAFVLPCTALVFLLWQLFRRRQQGIFYFKQAQSCPDRRRDSKRPRGNKVQLGPHSIQTYSQDSGKVDSREGGVEMARSRTRRSCF